MHEIVVYGQYKLCPLLLHVRHIKGRDRLEKNVQIRYFLSISNHLFASVLMVVSVDMMN